jgi:tetratricopeptide (TPR) repeat protein
MKKSIILLSIFYSFICYGQTAAEYSESGTAKEELEDYQGAILDYTMAIKIEPRNMMLYLKRGDAKYFLNDFRGAIADYSKGIEIDPNFAVLYISRGSRKDDLKDHQGAILDYKKANKINPDSNIYGLMGISYYSLKKYQEAIINLNKAIELDPDNFGAYHYRGIVKIKIGQKNSACLDWSKAGELGYTEAYNLIAKYCKK